MTDKPNIAQQDVDAVASFVEASNELDVEPFFGKDEDFSFNGPADGPATFYLGDRFHFRSALISFRSYTMPFEPSHWRNVVEILTRPNLPPAISNNASIRGNVIETLVCRDAGFLRILRNSSYRALAQYRFCARRNRRQK